MLFSSSFYSLVIVKIVLRCEKRNEKEEDEKRVKKKKIEKRVDFQICLS